MKTKKATKEKVKMVEISSKELKRLQYFTKSLFEIERAIFDAEIDSRDEGVEIEDIDVDIREWVRYADNSELTDLLNEILDIIGY